MTRALLLAALLGGCLSVTAAPVPQCKVTADCDSAHGEVCSDGTCYGNPPTGAFAALVSPPSDRTDLVARQVLDFRIPLDGRFADVQLDEPITYKGTLAGCAAGEPCDPTSMDATITVTGKSTFAGGPSFLGVFTAPAHEGFDLQVPRTHANETYSVTILPGGRDASPTTGTTAAQLIPPYHVNMAFTESAANQTISLGDGDATHPIHTLRGKISTTSGVPVSNYRVVAVGHWEPDGALVEVSTIDYTGTDGTYELQVSADLTDEVRIVATSYAAALRPTLSIGNIVPSVDSENNNLQLPDLLGSAHPVSIPVDGVNGSGVVGPIAGATVTITGSVMAGTTRATIVAVDTTDADGFATHLALLDGEELTASYRMAIVPPANASVGVLLDQPLTFAGSLVALRLPDRVAIRGRVRDHDGAPVKGVSVTARPALSFLWNLHPALQSVLSTVPPATTVTPESGEFIVFVDRALGTVGGRYDLAFDSTSAAQIPNYTQTDIAVPTEATIPAIALPDITLPDAAFVHGFVTDPDGKRVGGAELKIYELPSSQLTLCTQVQYAPASCPVPAQLLGRGASSASGELRVILPRN